ncbi:MAG: VacB/RNase II family 3'-5' exoribonuclease [Bacilli bacterium]|nr:VacB/RNase II family 3'-5' exoribonuclease [Bacilli bacterium]
MDKVVIGQIIESEEENSVYLRLPQRPDRIIPRRFLGNYHNKDIIICEIKEEKRTIMHKLHTFRENQVGEIIFDNGEPIILFSYKKGGKIRIPCKYFPNLYEGAKVRFKLDFNKDEVKAIVYQVLGAKDDMGIDIMDIAEQHGIPTVFSKKAMKQAKHTYEPRKESQCILRRDLRGETIFTIDGMYSKDFDDAVSLKRDGSDYILGVHIADVGYYIQEGSPLDLEARKRGMTAYLLSSVFPMFPKNISNGVCSLNERVDRYTLSVEMRISRTGIIKDITCFPSLIHSKKRMTYEEANLVLEGKTVLGYEAFETILYSMQSLAEILYASRIRNGAIDFDSNEPNIRLDSYGHVVDIKARNRGKSELLIQEFMLAANRSIAELLHEKGLIFPHRIHGQPDMGKLYSIKGKLETIGVYIEPLFSAKESERSMVFNELLTEYRNHSNYNIISNLLISCMRRAKYSLEDVGHFGLGLERNVHFTSPIRRYPDLMIHRILRKNYLFGIPQTAAEIEEMKLVTDNCTGAERRINSCEERVIRLKCREYLLDHVGETMEAVIKDCTDKGILVEIKDCIEELIPRSDLVDSQYDASKCHYTFVNSNVCYGIGTKLKVKLIKNKAIPDRVVLRIVNSELEHSYVFSKHNLY